VDAAEGEKDASDTQAGQTQIVKQTIATAAIICT
jgi:hypothetical protein